MKVNLKLVYDSQKSTILEMWTQNLSTIDKISAYGAKSTIFGNFTKKSTIHKGGQFTCNPVVPKLLTGSRAAEGLSRFSTVFFVVSLAFDFVVKNDFFVIRKIWFWGRYIEKSVRSVWDRKIGFWWKELIDTQELIKALGLAAPGRTCNAEHGH